MEKNLAKCCTSTGKIIPFLTLDTVVLGEHVSDNIFQFINSLDQASKQDLFCGLGVGI